MAEREEAGRTERARASTSAPRPRGSSRRRARPSPSHRRRRRSLAARVGARRLRVADERRRVDRAPAHLVRQVGEVDPERGEVGRVGRGRVGRGRRARVAAGVGGRGSALRAVRREERGDAPVAVAVVLVGACEQERGSVRGRREWEREVERTAAVLALRVVAVPVEACARETQAEGGDEEGGRGRGRRGSSVREAARTTPPTRQHAFIALPRSQSPLPLRLGHRDELPPRSSLASGTFLNLRFLRRTSLPLFAVLVPATAMKPSVTSTSLRCVVDTRRWKRCLAPGGTEVETSTMTCSSAHTSPLQAAWRARPSSPAEGRPGSEIVVDVSGVRQCEHGSCFLAARRRIGVSIGRARPNDETRFFAACVRRPG